MIGVIDYGLGNVGAFLNIFKDSNLEARPIRTPEDLTGISKFVLPGVGAFDWAMNRLNQSGLRASLDSAVLNDGVQALGVCVGMQMMGESSEEGSLPGLGWINGHVRRFRPDATRANSLPLPHMGWNDVSMPGASPLFAGFAESSRFYFLHSYYFEPQGETETLALTQYGSRFTSAVCHRSAYGVQFHPEKSHGWGIRLLKNFAEM